MPRFMMLVKASADSEAGVLPTADQMTEMGKYNHELVNAGVLLAGEGLQSSAKGARIYFKGDKKTVVDGPFSESKELVAGFWIIQAKSLEEAIEWAKKAPNPHFGGETNIEIRQIFAPEDFDAILAEKGVERLIDHHPVAAMSEQEKQLRERIATRQNG